MSGSNPFTGAYRIVYTSSAKAMTTLAPNTTATRKFLRMTGTGSAGAAPAWDTVTATDVGLGNVTNLAASGYFTAFAMDTTDTNKVSITIGGTTKTLTVGYATNAGTASKLGSSDLGSSTKGIYLDDGVAKACSYSLSATVNSGTQDKIAYYSGANAISSGKGFTDSTEAGAISSSGTDIPTERDIYFGLPFINNSHAYTSNTEIYAPTDAGSANQVLIAQGGTSAPT